MRLRSSEYLWRGIRLVSEWQWRFSVGAGGTGPKFLISLSRCCLPNDEGPAKPRNIFPRTATGEWASLTAHQNMKGYFMSWMLRFGLKDLTPATRHNRMFSTNNKLVLKYTRKILCRRFSSKPHCVAYWFSYHASGFLLTCLLLTHLPGWFFCIVVQGSNKNWQEGSSRKYASIDGVDFRFDVTLSRCRPRRHFTQKNAATWWVNQKSLPAHI